MKKEFYQCKLLNIYFHNGREAIKTTDDCIGFYFRKFLAIVKSKRNFFMINNRKICCRFNSINFYY